MQLWWRETLQVSVAPCPQSVVSLSMPLGCILEKSGVFIYLGCHSYMILDVAADSFIVWVVNRSCCFTVYLEVSFILRSHTKALRFFNMFIFITIVHKKCTLILFFSVSKLRFIYVNWYYTKAAIHRFSSNWHQFIQTIIQ